jgi:hypothetical protein
MVSAKDDSLPTNTEVFEAAADEAVASRSNDHDAEVRSTRSKILAIFDRKTYEPSFLPFQFLSILKHLATMALYYSIWALSSSPPSIALFLSSGWRTLIQVKWSQQMSTLILVL